MAIANNEELAAIERAGIVSEEKERFRISETNFGLAEEIVSRRNIL